MESLTASERVGSSLVIKIVCRTKLRKAEELQQIVAELLTRGRQQRNEDKMNTAQRPETWKHESQPFKRSEVRRLSIKDEL